MAVTPKCIKLTELADLLGVSRQALLKACHDGGFPVVKLRRIVFGEQRKGKGPNYLPIEAALEVAKRMLGNKTDEVFARKLKRHADRQDQSFGPRVDIQLTKG